MDAAWVGVVGAAVGAIAAYPFQALSAKRSDEYARSLSLRADRVVAYSSFADRIMDWRRSQVIRLLLEIDPPVSEEVAARVKDENRRARAAAWTAYYQVKLLSGEPKIAELGEAVIQTTRAMKNALDRTSMDKAGDDVRHSLEDFLDEAARQTTT